MPKAQATKKVPFSQRLGRRVTKLTLNAFVLAGRTSARVAKGSASGIVDASREFKKGFDEARAELES